MSRNVKQILLAALVAYAGAQECNLPGLCVGTTLATSENGSKQDCVLLCQSTPGCQFYTYDTKDGFCSAYESCPVRDEGCATCVSGEAACPPLLCDQGGGCVGILEDEFPTFGNPEACAAACQGDDQCNYYTYFTESGNCLLYSTCQISDGECSGCQTSEKECQADTSGVLSDYLIVVKGYNFDEISVIDLSPSALTCSSIDAGPVASISVGQSLQGTFAGGDLTVCGEEAAQCYAFDDSTGEWRDGPPMTRFRFLPFGVDMTPDLFWLTGGESEDDVYLASTEVFDGAAFAASGVMLPEGTRDHCVVRLTDTTAMLVTGYSLGNRAFIIDISSGDSQQILSVPFADTTDVLLAQCGKATKRGGEEVVVVAGGLDTEQNVVVDTAFVYDLSQSVWLPGPPLPETRAWGKAVQYGDSFVVVGGADSFSSGGVFREQILQYDPDGNAWVQLQQTLVNPDFVTAAVMAPQDFNVNCIFK